MTYFYYGFVSQQIQGNFHAWSTLSGQGTSKDADEFFEKHKDDDEVIFGRLTWYCYVPDEIPD